MSKRPPKYPWNRVPTCQRPYKPCAVENVSSRNPGWNVHMGRIRKHSSSVTEISVTGPARLLIWTHRNFCKEKSGEARSRKPSKPGQPGSYEEALIVLRRGVFSLFMPLKLRSAAQVDTSVSTITAVLIGYWTLMPILSKMNSEIFTQFSFRKIAAIIRENSCMCISRFSPKINK